MAIYASGNVITFNYVGKRATTRHPKVYVVHPRWEGLCHGIALQKISNRDVDQIKNYLKDSANDLTPLGIYRNLVLQNPVIRSAYRTYIPGNMSGVVVLRRNL